MKKTTITSITFAITIFIATALFNSCAIHPQAWNPPVLPSLTGNLALNEKLNTTQMISLQGWYGPEDIVFDEAGNLYCGVHAGASDFTDGRILKIDPKGEIEVFYNSGSWVAGLHFDQSGNLIALSHKEGLISISPKKEVTVLAKSTPDGKPFLIPNGLDIALDGKIYFTNTSDKSAWNIKYGRKIVLELIPNGGLYCYDPQSKEVTTLIDGTFFANGVVLSKDESYLLMVETTKYRVLRYWLRGEKIGQTEVFMDNLPGLPNGISIREDGSFWLGFSTKRNEALDKIHPKPSIKKIVYALPEWLQPQPEKFGIVMNISNDGKVLQTLYEPSGNILPETGAVKEYNGYLYIGGDALPAIGKYKLNEAQKPQS